jgi:hypothetical protein
MKCSCSAEILLLQRTFRRYAERKRFWRLVATLRRCEKALPLRLWLVVFSLAFRRARWIYYGGSYLTSTPSSRIRPSRSQTSQVHLSSTQNIVGGAITTAAVGRLLPACHHVQGHAGMDTALAYKCMCPTLTLTLTPQISLTTSGLYYGGQEANIPSITTLPADYS